MSLILALGSNIGHSLENLSLAKQELDSIFTLEQASRIYISHAEDYKDQPDFYNQVLQYALPKMKPDQVLSKILQIETRLGRQRKINKGPRTIDIDIIFYDFITIESNDLSIPHPRWKQRSFVVCPLKELTFYKNNKSLFQDIPDYFDNKATPLE